MQPYIFTSTFYLIVNVCGLWCQLVRWPSARSGTASLGLSRSSIHPPVTDNRATLTRLAAWACGRPRRRAAPAHQCRSVRICDNHYCYTWVCIYIVYARWHSNCVFSGLNHATTLITTANSVHQIIIA